MSERKINAIENALKKREIEFDLHLSGISKSAYFTFDNKDGETVVVRISNHELPAKYETRANRHVDFSFNDKTSDIVRFFELQTGKSTVKKENNIHRVTKEELEMFKKDAEHFGSSVETVARFYYPGKRIVFDKEADNDSISVTV